MYNKKLNVCLLFIVLSIFSATLTNAATAIIPTGYSTVQDAVNAVQGTVDPRVIINSNAIFAETVTITQSVIIEAGTGYTPVIRGTSPGKTIYFNPDSTSTQALSLRNLTVLPRTGIGPGSGDSIIRIYNAGTGATDILIEGLRLNDPENAGPDGIEIRLGGPNNVMVQNTTITLGGGPGYGVDAFFMGGLGTLTVSNVIINMSGGDGWGFDIRGSLESGISFTLEDSVFNLSAPLGPYHTEIGRLSDLVSATIQRNTFNLISNEQGSATGIVTGWGSQDVTLDSNRFNGSGPKVGSAYNAYPSEGDTGSVIATNNVIFNQEHQQEWLMQL